MDKSLLEISELASVCNKEYETEMRNIQECVFEIINSLGLSRKEVDDTLDKIFGSVNQGMLDFYNMGRKSVVMLEIKMNNFYIDCLRDHLKKSED